MGMQAGGSKGGAKSEINVTPLVDVCLVLLIIFMVMVPRNVPEISVRVPPESKQKRPPREQSDTLVLGLSKDGAITLNHNPIDRTQLEDTLKRQLEFRDKRVVFVDFDDDANYGTAVELLDVAKRAGADVLGIVKKKDKPVADSLVGI
ncbi:MAG: biopolymer transporter ExbD [Deltaproteobacteria bacterium]|nr:MAG: biopolymer transporter ExbD [Deltaproteobacteria bacterium]